MKSRSQTQKGRGKAGEEEVNKEMQVSEVNEENEANEANEQADEDNQTSKDKAEKARARREKFRQLKMRLNQSSAQNQQEMFAEYRRKKQDPAAAARLERKQADAELALAKEDAKDTGEDFERKRAWDWTIEEAERWDERQERKKQAKSSALVTDFGQAAVKAYERELRNFKPDMQAYLDQKARALQKAGQLVEAESGQLVAVDGENAFYGDLNSLEFSAHKPPKDAVDRLANSIQKADEQRMKKVQKPADETDIFSINDRNRHFNKKLGRYYDKYTKEIRDSFERGTAL